MVRRTPAPKPTQAIDSKNAQATVPADDAMIKTQIVKELGGHKVFDRKVQDALQATWAGYIAHAELSAVVAKLPGPSEKEKKDWGNKGRNEFLKLLKKHNQRQLPQEPMPCKAKSIDLQGMEVTEKEEGMLAQVVSRVPGFTRVNLSGCKLGDGFVKCLVAQLDEGGLAGVESLSLESNAISEQGMQDLAAAIARGGLPSCTTIFLTGQPGSREGGGQAARGHGGVLVIIRIPSPILRDGHPCRLSANPA